MTYRIPLDSTRRGSSEMFGVELRRAMAARKVGQRTLAEAVGTGRTSIVNYMQGNTMPRIAQADAMAVALNWPRLGELIRLMRTAICRTCGAEFLNDSSTRAWYCRNGRCQLVAAKRRVGVPVANRADNAERDLAAALADLGAHQLAVAGFCAECEPEGLCKTSGCALRPVSPLPLAGVQVQQVRSRGNGSHSAERRVAQAARMRQRWASDEARAAQARQSRAWWAGLTHEERELQIELIRAGKAAVS